MKKEDQKFLELYLNSISLISPNNKIICDENDHILYKSKNVINKQLIGSKLKLNETFAGTINKELEYSPITGNLLMKIYTFADKPRLSDYQPENLAYFHR